MAITIDVKKGDTILVRKFKNKKMVIKNDQNFMLKNIHH